jgi:hypothetical protein
VIFITNRSYSCNGRLELDGTSRQYGSAQPGGSSSALAAAGAHHRLADGCSRLVRASIEAGSSGQRRKVRVLLDDHRSPTREPPAPQARNIRPTGRLCVGSRSTSKVDVATPPPPERPRAQLPLELHDAPDPGAVRADAGFDVGSHLVCWWLVDAELLRTLLKRCRDRPATFRVVSFPDPHVRRVVEHTFTHEDPTATERPRRTTGGAPDGC